MRECRPSILFVCHWHIEVTDKITNSISFVSTADHLATTHYWISVIKRCHNFRILQLPRGGMFGLFADNFSCIRLHFIEWMNLGNWLVFSWIIGLHNYIEQTEQLVRAISGCNKSTDSRKNIWPIITGQFRLANNSGSRTDSPDFDRSK